MVHTVPFHIDCAEGPCRTEIFTLAATDAAFVVNSRHKHKPSVGCGVLHHLYRAAGAMTGTGGTRVAFADGDTVLLYPYRMSDLDGRLLLLGDGPYSSRRAYLRTTRTLRAAVTALKGHGRLHEMQWVRGWAEHVVRTRGDA